MQSLISCPWVVPSFLSVMGVSGFLLGQNPVYEERVKAASYEVHILALSTSTRVSGVEEDVYLATIGNETERQHLVKLLDVHGERPIRQNLLETEPTFRMKLTRSSSCDAEAKTFFIGQWFHTRAEEELRSSPDKELLCFQVRHDATKLFR